MLVIPSIACCKLPSTTFWITKKCTLSKRDNASLTWSGPFCYSLLFKKFFPLPNHTIRVYVKGYGYGLEIPAEHIFYGNDKAIQWEKRTLYGVGGSVKKKVLRYLK